MADEHYDAVEEEEDDDVPEDPGAVSPCGFGPIDQDKLEVILRKRAIELGADVRFSTELVSFEQDDEGVTARIRDRRTGETSTVRADYLIACDGWASPIRERLGIPLDGPGPLFHTITAIVDADLRPATGGRKVTVAYLRRPQPFTIMLAHNEEGTRWVFGTGYSPEHERLEDYTDERVTELVRAAAGIPDLQVTVRPQIPGTQHKIFGFSVGAQVARQYRSGRVFLVGDAAHLVPPTGGFGGNAGIQDAHNLAWKLAAVVRGEAGPALLETYHEERRPVGLMTMAQALARFGDRMGPGAETPLLDHAAVSMGYRYHSAAIVDPVEGDPVSPAKLRGEPGTRAPHLPIEGGVAGAHSTIDLYGKNAVLLAGPAGSEWVSGATSVARELGIPLDAYRFGGEITGEDGPERYGIGTDGAVLIRPDGFVAWRSAGPVADPAREVERVLRTVWSRS
jgi:2-polyprenyl-6-methoxyphenol hydroxylase-like FAD-dependent oxidoreductase